MATNCCKCFGKQVGKTETKIKDKRTREFQIVINGKRK